MSDTCPDCGDEVDGFSPCGCVTTGINPKVAARRVKDAQSRQIAAGGMRGMVARKMARQAAKRESVG